MDSNSKTELIRLACALVIIFTQYWAMYADHFPVYAVVWAYITRLAQKIAAWFGWLALRAEYNYYIAVEMSQ